MRSPCACRASLTDRELGAHRVVAPVRGLLGRRAAVDAYDRVMARTRHPTDVTVSRVQADDTYVRVNSVGDGGIRPFVLVPGIGVSSTYFERLAPRLLEFGPV